MLTDWIVSAAAERAAFRCRATSIPGVAQRTGATTYYIEIFPVPLQRARRQAAGAGADARRRRHRHRGGERTAGGGRARSPTASSRPTARMLIASTSRFYADGREDRDGRRPLRSATRLIKAIEQNAQRRICCSTWTTLAQQSRRDHQRGDARRHRRQRAAADPGRGLRGGDPRRRQGGRGNLRGFRAGLDAARAKAAAVPPADPGKRAPPPPSPRSNRSGGTARRGARDRRSKACAASSPIRSVAYARLYLDRLAPIAMPTRTPARWPAAARDRAASRGAHVVRGRDPRRAGQDRAGAHRRIEGEESAPSGEPFTVTNSSSPASRSCARCCRRAWRARSCAFAERRGWLGRVYFGMEIKTTSVCGYPALLAAREAAAAAAAYGYRYPRGAGADRGLARADRRGREALARARARGRRMRAADQGLWRHPGARQRQLRADRDARDPPVLAGRIPLQRGASTRSPARAPPRWSIRKARACAKCLAELEARSRWRIAAE